MQLLDVLKRTYDAAKLFHTALHQENGVILVGEQFQNQN